MTAEIAVAARVRARVKAGREERQARDPARGRRVAGEIPAGVRAESPGRDLVMSQIKRELGRAQ